MIGFKKEQNKKQDSCDLLQLDSIRLNCIAKEKTEVIREIGQILCDSGAVDTSYIDAMIKREQTLNTYIGNGIALPHGVEEAKKTIRHSGVAVMVFPEGTDWDGVRVKLVIAIAGAGDDHLEILSNIASNLAEPEDVERILKSSVQQIYNIFTGKEHVK